MSINELPAKHSGTDPAARGSHVRLAARLGRFLAVLAFSGLSLGLVSTAPAGAATTTNKIGQYTASQCGWIGQFGELYDWRITIANLPWVTGTSTTRQLIWVHAQFTRTDGSVYRDGWFYTYAVSGQWTKTWTAYSNGQTGFASVQDAAGEGGSTNVGIQSFVKMTMLWTTGGTTTGSVAEWSTSTHNTNNTYNCNGGSPLAPLPV